MVALPFRYIMNIAWTWQLHNMNTDGCICSVCVVLEFRCCLREGIEKGLVGYGSALFLRMYLLELILLLILKKRVSIHPF